MYKNARRKKEERRKEKEKGKNEKRKKGQDSRTIFKKLKSKKNIIS